MTDDEIREAVEAALRALLAQGFVLGRGPIAEIAAERQRQVEVEGWTAEHDDEHGLFELTEAAVCYASWTADVPMNFDRFQDKLVPRQWPWAASWWKPRDDRSNLIRAGALIVAEIERLDRLPSPPVGAAE